MEAFGYSSAATSTSTQGTSSTEAHYQFGSAVPAGVNMNSSGVVDVFNPTQRVGNKVVAKGVLIPTLRRTEIASM